MRPDSVAHGACAATPPPCNSAHLPQAHLQQQERLHDAQRVLLLDRAAHACAGCRGKRIAAQSGIVRLGDSLGPSRRAPCSQLIAAGRAQELHGGAAGVDARADDAESRCRRQRRGRHRGRTGGRAELRRPDPELLDAGDPKAWWTGDSAGRSLLPRDSTSQRNTLPDAALAGASAAELRRSVAAQALLAVAPALRH
eukprot:364290-Chlamydomonas_euryale.AAC.10